MHACLNKQYQLHMVVLRTDRHSICEYVVDSFGIENTKVQDRSVCVELAACIWLSAGDKRPTCNVEQ